MWIYVIRNAINGKLYVGQTERDDPNERWKEHLECVRGTRRQRLYTAMRCYGVENFEFNPIEEQATIQDLDDAERFWIEFFRSWDEEFGYNKTKGGQWGRLTPDKIRRLSELNSGEKNPFYGKHHSEDARRAIGAASKGNQHGKGVFLSKDQKQRQSESLKKSWASDVERKRQMSKRMSDFWKSKKLKLSFDDVENIQKRLASGDQLRIIANDYHVSVSTIMRVKKGLYRCATIR